MYIYCNMLHIYLLRASRLLAERCNASLQLAFHIRVLPHSGYSSDCTGNGGKLSTSIKRRSFSKTDVSGFRVINGLSAARVCWHPVMGLLTLVQSVRRAEIVVINNWSAVAHHPPESLQWLSTDVCSTNLDIAVSLYLRDFHLARLYIDDRRKWRAFVCKAIFVIESSLTLMPTYATYYVELACHTRPNTDPPWQNSGGSGPPDPRGGYACGIYKLHID